MKEHMIFSDGEFSRIGEWIEADGDVLASLEFERSRLSADSYLVQSVEALGHLVAATRFWPHRVNIHVFRGPFPVRGEAGVDLLRRAMAEILEGELFHIVDAAITYPLALCVHGIGQTHREMEEYFGELGTEVVAIGRHPMDWPADEWVRAHPDTAIRRVSWSGTCSEGNCRP